MLIFFMMKIEELECIKVCVKSELEFMLNLQNFTFFLMSKLSKNTDSPKVKRLEPKTFKGLIQTEEVSCI